VNAFGNVGGYVGQKFVGWLSDLTHSTDDPFIVLGVGMLACTGLAFLLPKARLSPAAPALQSPNR
jgi:nitrate/nitrite transporter NarK